MSYLLASLWRGTVPGSSVEQVAALDGGAEYKPRRTRVSAKQRALGSRPGRSRRRLLICATVRAAAAAAEAAEAAAGGRRGSLDLVGMTLIIDDIVLPDGTSCMARLGGGGPQTLWGFQLQRRQAARVALAAGVGPDLPSSCMDWLIHCGIDTSGLVLCEGRKTPRAWQILEEDGRRHEIWRTPFNDELVSMLRPQLAALPPAFRRAQAFHVGVHPQDPSLTLLHELREAAGTQGLVSAETFAAATAPVPAAAIREFMAPLDVFSPNEAEAASMLHGPGTIPEASHKDPRRLTEPFLEAGAKLVALRRGSLGAVVHDGATGAAWSVPAFPGTNVIDPTGCGNAFCGALLAALQEGAEFPAAVAWGCAAGSLMAEWQGTPAAAPAELAEAAQNRQAAVLQLALQL